MKYLYLPLVLFFLFNGKLESQNIEFENHVKIISNTVGFYNPSNVANFMFTDGEGDFQLLGGKILEYKRNGDLIKYSGGEWQLNSTNDTKHFAFNVDNDNVLNISRTNGTSAIHIDGDDEHLGINTTFPITELHVRQKQRPSFPNGVFGIVDDLAGLTIEDDRGIDWMYFIDLVGDLNLAYNSTHKSYIRFSDGRYVTAAGQAPARRQEKSDIHIGDRISKLDMYYNSNKANDNHKKGIVLDVDQLASLFPEAVDVKAEGKGIVYSEFGLIALRAIQEQQELIKTLVERIEQLEKK